VPSNTITYGYDNLDRLTSETTPQGSVSYTFDNAGRRTSMTVAGQPTVNYTYDQKGTESERSNGLSSQERVRLLREWASGHSSNTPLLSDDAISRERIYG